MHAAKSLVLNEFMAAAAKSTGGQFLQDSNDWASGLRNAAAVPEVSYVLGFAPPGDPDGEHHSLKIRIPARRDYRVESRTGYFAAAPAAAHESVQQRIDRIVMSSEERKEFPVRIEARQGVAEEGRPTVEVTMALDARALRFAKAEGRELQELTFLTVLEDAHGNFVAGKQAVMDLVLLPATLAEKRQNGIRAAVALQAPGSGAYRLREVVRELAQDRIWSSTEPLLLK